MKTGAGAVRWQTALLLSGSFILILAVAAAVPTLLRQDQERYEWRDSWGSSRSGEDGLRRPIGIAVDDSGFVYVSDSGRDRIVKFDSTGDYVSEWGGTGREPGRLRRPMHIELVEDSLLYVAEYLNDRIQLFRLDGTPVELIVEDESGPLGGLDAPGGVASTPDQTSLWISDFFNHRVAVYGRGGDFRRRVGASGRWLPGRFHYPTDVAFGPEGTAFVADAYNHRIQRYSSDGNRLVTWGGPLGLGIPGPWKGWFSVATGVHVDRTGRVYVADFYNDRIQAFTSSGEYVAEWGESGSDDGAFDRPTDVATGPEGRIYVVDFGNDRIQVFECVTCGEP